MRKSQTILVGLAMVVASCGGSVSTSSTTSVVPGQTTTSTTRSTSVPAPGTTAPARSSTTTTIPATTTTASPTTTTTHPAGPIELGIYFYIDEAGHPERTGPFLVPVAKEVPHTVAVARAAIEELLAGPSANTVSDTPSISTAIPVGVDLLGLDIERGLAIIDLSSDFGGSDDSAATAQRLAQVVFTLTRFETVDRVLFHQDGAPIQAQTGDGNLVDRPVTRDDYLDFAAALDVERPLYGGRARNPLRVVGIGAVFEAAFLYRLTDAEDHVLAEGQAMTDLGTGWGNFDFTIPYVVDRKQMGSLVVWDDSAKDGSAIDIRQYPVVLGP
ncbi:MAG: GerMN domain-containing protein [Acidimicrobiia bacterium]